MIIKSHSTSQSRVMLNKFQRVHFSWKCFVCLKINVHVYEVVTSYSAQKLILSTCNLHLHLTIMLIWKLLLIIYKIYDYDYDYEITLYEHKQNQHIHIIIVQ